MDTGLYAMIPKRRSFHTFKSAGRTIGGDELNGIRAAWEGFEKLYLSIKTEIRIVPARQVHFRHGAEYCILIYSEPKENYLINAGYIGMQLDLYCVARGIGTLWWGLGKPDEKKYQGLDYVIAIAIRKMNDPEQFRKDPAEASRKPLDETWTGDPLGIAETARLAPSACNSQPWSVRCENKTLTVSRYKKPGRVGIMPSRAACYYNRIDIGIYLCALELCLAHGNIKYTKTLFADDGEEGRTLTKVAEYALD